MKKILLTSAMVIVSFALVSSASAAVSSPCSGYTKPVKQAAPAKAPAAPVVDTYRRDVLGNKVPTQTDKAGNALNDEATGYHATLLTGNE